jgi:hypothetical protein
LAAEPVVLAWAVFVGTAIHFPAALRHPFLTSLDRRPALVVFGIVVLFGVAGAARLFAAGRRSRGLATVLGLGLTIPLPAAHGGLSWRRAAETPPLVLLGLDSVSMTSDVGPLRELADRHGGVFYRRAVTPGLITNAVWHSLLLMEPVRSHGIFFAGQRWPRPGEAAPLLAAASAAGYESISFIPDSSSCFVGGEAGFDENRSGPLGWRQIILPPASEASLLLPLVRPLLPRLPFSPAQPNQAATFTYDLDRDLREMLTAGREGRPTLVAAHTAYLHMKAFPRRNQLNTEQWRALFVTPLFTLLDRSFDWQDVDQEWDPIPLHAWKHRRLLAAVVEGIEKTTFLERGGRLILFSDHGDRFGVTPDNFAEPRYFHVPLVTFHLPGRDPELPISLLDIPTLAGLTPDRPPAPVVVDYAMTPPVLWPVILEQTRPRWDGSVEPPQELLAKAFRRLRSYQPVGRNETGPPAAPTPTVP